MHEGRVLAIDLAARFSAAVILDDGGLKSHGTVVDEHDSWGYSPLAWCDVLGELAQQHDVELIVIEDVPYGISSQKMVKPVLRLQGALIAHLAQRGLLNRTLFVAPATWQRATGVFGKAKIGARALAQSFGYSPPDLLAERVADYRELKGRERSTVRGQLKKAMTDYDDAFLMAYWAGLHLHDIRTLQGVQEPST